VVAPVDPGIGLVACSRFGLGARPGDIARAASDPRGFLKAELRTQDVALLLPDDPRFAGLGDSTAAIEASMAAADRRKLDRERLSAMTSPSAAGSPEAAMAGAAAGTAGDATMAASRPDRKAETAVEQDIFRREARARFAAAAAAEAGFVERLVAFWSNHFCVSAAKGPIVRAAAGPYEREAIRPHVLGRFADMLLAVERHPAMLFYLDNQQSIGPDSRAGKRGRRGLNENLAREIFELHTLGVDGGYTQSDVTSFARTLTGWMMAGRDGRLGQPGSFVFNANAHEPGDGILLGRTYPDNGIGQAEAVLNDIARHPATARHIATKLARHFIADDPPPQAVARIETVFLDTDGDLGAIAAQLVDTPEAWSMPLRKVRSPYDYVVAIRRAAYQGEGADPRQLLGWLNALGAPLWQPPGPNGFPDSTEAAASPEGMKVRLDIASQAARQARDIANPTDMLAAVIGPAASAETRAAIARAESRAQGLALLFMAPEFQRR
jgi:uncharacterized protein (DUF1800 family)